MSAQQVIDDVAALVADPRAAGISIRSKYRSMANTLTPPAGTVGHKGTGKAREEFQGIFEMPDGRKAVTIDSWGSQARRWSTTVDRHLEQAGLPGIEFIADLGDKVLPHNSSWTWSHKHADAIFRVHREEVEGSGVDFEALMGSSQDCADALLQWFPNSILTGWWNSHSGKAVEGDQKAARAFKLSEPEKLSGSVHASKSARVMSSEIIATGVSLRTRYAARVDSVFGAMPGKTVKVGSTSYRLSGLGFGSIPPTAAPKDVTFADVEGIGWISLTRLRAFQFETFDPQRARTALVLLALYGIALGTHDLHLRSGTDLVLDSREVFVERHQDDAEPFEIPSVEVLAEALQAFAGEFEWKRVQVDLSGSKNLKDLLALASSTSATDEDQG